MKRAEEDRLDRLLARGRLSRPEKERMFDAVRASQAPPTRSWLGVLRFVVPAFAALLLVPYVMLHRHDDGFHDKGNVGAARIEAACAGGCRSGATLVFRTADVASASVLAAWADDERGQRIWYFPTDQGEMPEVAPHHAAEPLRRGIHIGAEHGSPRYTLTMALLPAGTYTRDEVLKRDLPHVQQPLEIER